MVYKVLELFKGSGSITKYCNQYPNLYNVVSIDIEHKYEATITKNILEWDYTEYDPYSFDIIWASPPCTEYSILLNCLKNRLNRVRNLNLADAIVIRVLDILEYFKPKIWFIENPQTGLLKTREFMQDIPYYDVSYCKYGYKYRKHTRIWTNLLGFKNKVCKKDCGNIRENRHIQDVSQTSNLLQKYSIPSLLIDELFKCAIENMTL